MDKFLLKEISGNNIEFELDNIGFDISYRHKAKDKFLHKNIKIFDLTVAQANILKQTALSFGADCAVHRNVVTGNIEKSDAILCGSVSQIKKIAEKLKFQPFGLKNLAENILALLLEKTRSTKLVGILNLTTNSFSDGGMYIEPEKAKEHLINLIKDGADVIDIGAESTKPFSSAVSAKEQINRLQPILEFIQKENLKTTISIDTRLAEVADFALNNGVQIINDVSGFDFDLNLAKVVSKYNATVVIQHSQGNPKTMQVAPVYKNVVEEIFLSLSTKIDYAKSEGIKDIIIDPGIGFGKTIDHNFQILNNIEEFFVLEVPVMIGISRKSFLGINESNNELKDSLSLALSYPLIQKRIDYLRVHNVKLYRYLLNLQKNTIPN